MRASGKIGFLSGYPPAARYDYGREAVRTIDVQKINPHDVLKSIKLSARDKEILQSIVPVVHGIAELFGRNCEVILHSFEDPGHSVMEIANAHITGRKVGSPITDLGLSVLVQSFTNNTDIVGSYYTRTETGKLFRSITILVRNGKKNPIGMLCINIDLNAPLIDFINDFVPGSEEKNQTVENYPTEINDLVHTALEACITRINLMKGISSAEKNKMTIAELMEKGVFEIKGAIEIVAGEMGISKYTIYHHIRELKKP